MIITMDGPAGAGKSSVARKLAQQLDFAFLDTGAMYRCATYACLLQQVDLQDARAVEACANTIQIDFNHDKVYLNGTDVTSAIRTPEVTQSIKYIADNVKIRERMVKLQRDFAKDRDIVTEGRDQGTVAFPHAECKFFLTASPEERARRRVDQLALQGISSSFEEVLRLQQARDQEDTQREVGALRVAEDSIYILTDNLTEEQVIEKLVCLVLDLRRQIFDLDNSFPAHGKQPQRKRAVS